jgi:hypothetical protein
MADSLVVKTLKSITRAELEAVFPKSPRLVRAFENLLADVAETLPGAVGLTGDDIHALQLGAYARPPTPMSIRAGAGLLAAPDAAGVALSLDLAQAVGAMAAFMPRQPPATVRPDDVQLVLAGQIFRR